MEGFTLSEFEPAKLLTGALVDQARMDQARKHRKRSPEETERMNAARTRGRMDGTGR